jgi:chitin disaccharide deacetylase
VPGSELESLTRPTSVPYRWAADYRVSDLAVVTDPEVRELIDELEIRLRSLSEALG